MSSRPLTIAALWLTVAAALALYALMPSGMLACLEAHSADTCHASLME